MTDTSHCPGCAAVVRLADSLIAQAFLNEAADEMASLLGEKPCRGQLAESQRHYAELIRYALREDDAR